MTNICKTTRDFSEEERLRLLEQFESSGLGYQEFAREHNVNEHTLRNWIVLKANPERKYVRFSPTERKKAVEAFLSSGMKTEEFCGAWGLSTVTLNKWLRLYEQHGADGLMDRPRRPDDRRVGMKIPRSVQDEIVAAKRREPGWGLKSIKNWLYRSRGVKVSTGSIRKTMKNEGLSLAQKPKKRRRSSDKVRRFERARPMQLWQSDITQYTLGPSSQRVYLTVFMDDHSRYVVGWRLQSRQTAELVLDAFKGAVLRYGKPEEVLTDQGRQYFAWRGKSELEKLLEKEGIKHVVSRAHHPQTLGKCERFWETVTNEFWTRAKPQDLEEARERLKYFIDHYNHQRPHQGIDGQVPADRFFGVAEEVREIIEKSVIANSLRLAVGELPKPPAFLIGQVGDQKIAFHGTSGGFYLTHENVKGENEDGNPTGNSVANFAIDRGVTDATEKTTPRKADGLLAQAELPSDPSQGSLGSGDGGSSWTSPGNCDDNDGGMGGATDEGSSRIEAWNEAIEVLADEPPSDGRHDGGSFDPAAQAREDGGDANDGERRDQDAQEESPRPPATARRAGKASNGAQIDAECDSASGGQGWSTRTSSKEGSQSFST